MVPAPSSGAPSSGVWVFPFVSTRCPVPGFSLGRSSPPAAPAVGKNLTGQPLGAVAVSGYNTAVCEELALVKNALLPTCPVHSCAHGRLQGDQSWIAGTVSGLAGLGCFSTVDVL